MANTEFKTIQVTKIECNDGTNKNGKPYKLWKVYDEDGLYFSGFKDPGVVEGESYIVTFSRSGDQQQFFNYQKFTKTEPKSQTTLVGNRPTWADREEAKNKRITIMHYGKQSVKLIDLALTHNKSIAEIMIMYGGFMKALTVKEPADGELEVEEEKVM